MQSLRGSLNARLIAAAEEIFVAVRKTIWDDKEETCCSKDLEISRLQMQIKTLQSIPAVPTREASEETKEGSGSGGGTSMEQRSEHPDPSSQQIKEEPGQGGGGAAGP